MAGSSVAYQKNLFCSKKKKASASKKTKDYSTFGSSMPGRSFSSGSYRYGFNGQEKELEINSSVTSAEHWMYDARLGRRWELDPVVNHEESGYATMRNSPIVLNDPSGDCPTCPQGDNAKDTKVGDVHYSSESYGHTGADGSIIDHKEGSVYAYVNTGKDKNGFQQWVLGGIIEQGGTTYNWNSEKAWYSNDQGGEYQNGASSFRSAAFTIGNGAIKSIKPFAQMFIDGVQKDDPFDAVKSAKEASGKKWGDFLWEGLKTNAVDLFAGGYKGNQARLSFYSSFLSSGGYLGWNPSGSFTIGGTFRQYKNAVGGTQTLGFVEVGINAAGKPILQRISSEFHHAIITQRMQKSLGLKDWMVNNSLNVWKMNTVQHSIIDSYRFNFLRAGMKSQVGLFRTYNLFTKFPKK